MEPDKKNYAEKDWERLNFLRFEIKKINSANFLHFYVSICPQHQSSRKFDLMILILIYDHPTKKELSTAVVIQIVLRPRPCFLFWTGLIVQYMERSDF